jgi:hypothetical protein
LPVSAERPLKNNPTGLKASPSNTAMQKPGHVLTLTRWKMNTGSRIGFKIP